MRYAKAVAAILAAGLTAAQAALPMSAKAHSYVAVGLAVLGAVAVYAVPNAPPKLSPGVAAARARKTVA
jgi:hypothetical protein